MKMTFKRMSKIGLSAVSLLGIVMFLSPALSNARDSDLLPHSILISGNSRDSGSGASDESGFSEDRNGSYDKSAGAANRANPNQSIKTQKLCAWYAMHIPYVWPLGLLMTCGLAQQ